MYSILLSAGWPIWPLLIISILGLAIAIERAWYLRQANILPKMTLESAFNLANQLSAQKAIAEVQIAQLHEPPTSTIHHLQQPAKPKQESSKLHII